MKHIITVGDTHEADTIGSWGFNIPSKFAVHALSSHVVDFIAASSSTDTIACTLNN